MPRLDDPPPELLEESEEEDVERVLRTWRSDEGESSIEISFLLFDCIR